MASGVCKTEQKEKQNKPNRNEMKRNHVSIAHRKVPWQFSDVRLRELGIEIKELIPINFIAPVRLFSLPLTHTIGRAPMQWRPDAIYIAEYFVFRIVFFLLPLIAFTLQASSLIFFHTFATAVVVVAAAAMVVVSATAEAAANECSLRTQSVMNIKSDAIDFLETVSNDSKLGIFHRTLSNICGGLRQSRVYGRKRGCEMSCMHMLFLWPLLLLSSLFLPTWSNTFHPFGSHAFIPLHDARNLASRVCASLSVCIALEHATHMQDANHHHYHRFV